ncbi:CAP-gly domain linker [Heracleum sosnowskyi]|uniref:CAP-gly domain linker n=1 Tax=Heracleum sosnowskyi TaxID=360622 RepID=A0AAD8IQ22_9APIA|nr:CAP-gly domain linker [Heracleum sosnowskyi]
MEDSGAILCQISLLKDMLDQVNEEIESNYEITREIESEIVKCCEIETEYAVRESELTRTSYHLHFEINGFMAVTSDAMASITRLKTELSSLRIKRDEICNGMNKKQEEFISCCLDFQKDIDQGENCEMKTVLSEKVNLENEIKMLTTKKSSLQNSVSAFVEDLLENLRCTNSALHFEIQSGNLVNQKLLKDIDELKATLLSVISMNSGISSWNGLWTGFYHYKRDGHGHKELPSEQLDKLKPPEWLIFRTRSLDIDICIPHLGETKYAYSEIKHAYWTAK